VARRGPDGVATLSGHVGAIYRTFGRGVVYRGRGTARTEHLTPDGRPFSSPAASKIRNRESGCAYAVDELVRRGAPRPAEDDLCSWYDGLVGQGVLRPRRHPGHHVYAFALTQAAKLAGRDLPTGAFPQRGSAELGGDVTGLPLFG
jgi:hypothetical protein